MSDNPSLPYTEWPSFPFEGELRVKPLDPPVELEPPRHGENPIDCRACNSPDEAYIWVNERWRVRSLDRPTGLPVVLVLEPRSHLDLGDLPNLLAAELGVMTVRVERAIRSLDGVARVHVNRWGDGPSHLHTWFLARPYGRLQLQGTFLSIWNDILPPLDEEPWRENLALVAAWLAEFGGTALAEPPRIHWTAPSSFAPDPVSPATSTTSDAPVADPAPVRPTNGHQLAADEPAGDTPLPTAQTKRRSREQAENQAAGDDVSAGEASTPVGDPADSETDAGTATRPGTGAVPGSGATAESGPQS